MRSAVQPSSTKRFSPSSRQPPSAGVAVSATRSNSQRPSGSVSASVPRCVPAASAGNSASFCASVPPCWMAPVASTAEEKYGAHNSARPISSNAMPSSTNENPCPPHASGTWMAQKPNSPASRSQTAGSKPPSVSIKRRTAVDGDTSPRNRRATSRNWRCSSVKLKGVADIRLKVADCGGRVKWWRKRAPCVFSRRVAPRRTPARQRHQRG